MEREIWKPGNMLYPVPAVMVSCMNKEGKANIVTIAWAGTICSDPAMLSISVRKSRYSYDIIKEQGEFAVNLVTEDLTRACDLCGVKSGRDVDKFADNNLTKVDLPNISCPGIAESPVIIECKVKDIIELGSHDMFLAEVVGVSVDKAYLDENGKFNLDKAKLIAYSHGKYFSLGNELGSFGYSVRKK